MTHPEQSERPVLVAPHGPYPLCMRPGCPDEARFVYGMEPSPDASFGAIRREAARLALPDPFTHRKVRYCAAHAHQLYGLVADVERTREYRA